jgi:hypothetical protein
MLSYIFSLAMMKFSNQSDGSHYVIVGIAKDYQLNPKIVGGGFLYTYK